MYCTSMMYSTKCSVHYLGHGKSTLNSHDSYLHVRLHFRIRVKILQASFQIQRKVQVRFMLLYKLTLEIALRNCAISNLCNAISKLCKLGCTISKLVCNFAISNLRRAISKLHKLQIVWNIPNFLEQAPRRLFLTGPRRPGV